MRLLATPLRKRIFIAIVALAVIHAAFYAVPRYIATRPRLTKRRTTRRWRYSGRR